MIYLRFTRLDCKDVRIRKSEFVAKSQFFPPPPSHFMAILVNLLFLFTPVEHGLNGSVPWIEEHISKHYLYPTFVLSVQIKFLNSIRLKVLEQSLFVLFIVVTKELSLCPKLKAYIPYIFATWCCNLLIF